MRKIIQLGTRLPPLTLSWGSREIYSSEGALTEMKTSTQITFMEDAPQLFSENARNPVGAQFAIGKKRFVFCQLCSPC